MKRHWIILIGAMIWGFLMVPGNAMAHQSHSGVHAQSPFDAPKEKKSLHCLLLRHQHTALPFCPHTKHGKSAKTQLKTDCGNSPSGIPIQVQWTKTLVLCPSVEKTAPALNIYSAIPKQLQLPSLLPDLLEKPPQHA